MAQNLTQFLQSLADAKPEQRLRVANYLKKAGFYSGKVSAEFNSRLITAVSRAEQEIDMLKPFVGDMDRLTFYVQRSKDGTGEGPKTTRQRFISTEQSISKTLDDIAKDLLGRALTDKEKSKYAKRLIQEQRKSSSDVVQTYTEGDATGMQTTTAGLDEGQFLIEQISQTDEAKANRALKGYDLMLRMLGGLR